jgi:hypothetical protein
MCERALEIHHFRCGPTLIFNFSAPNAVPNEREVQKPYNQIPTASSNWIRIGYCADRHFIDDIIVLNFRTNRYTWLPRQDQIQELIIHNFNPDNVQWDMDNWSPDALISRSHLTNFHVMMMIFSKFCCNAKITSLYSTVDQMWLGFFMHLVHKKLWDVMTDDWEVDTQFNY